MGETRIRFEGGPLDGTERRKTVPARSPIYRNTDGEPIGVTAGDRITNGRSGTPACYRKAGQHVVGTTKTITYSFITREETRS